MSGFLVCENTTFGFENFKKKGPQKTKKYVWFFFWSTCFQLCSEPRSPGSKFEHVLFKKKRVLDKPDFRVDTVGLNLMNRVKQLFFLIFFLEQFKLIATRLKIIYFFFKISSFTVFV